MGQELGLANQLVMAATALAIVLMSISAVVMRWKRRPRGQLGVPPPPADRRVALGVLAIVAAAGMIFPLTGLSLMAALTIDAAIRRGLRRSTSAQAA